MCKLTVVTLGDSVAWGQGLRTEQKFNQLAAGRIASILGIPNERVEVRQYAHSGAVVRKQDTPPRLDPDRDPMWPEVPWGTPTVFEQTAIAPDPDVDLVLLTAGINDIGFPKILDPTGSRYELRTAIRQNCYFDIKQLLERIRKCFPCAVIVVTGYYPMLSEQSDLGTARILISLLGLPAGSIGGSALASSAVGKRVSRRVRFFARRQLYWLRLAVMEKHRDTATRGPGILFAHPAFGPQHSVGARHQLLFSPRQEWRQLLQSDSPSDLLRIESDDPMATERVEACDIYQDRIQNAADQVKCRVAAIGHPNPAGARRYADAITTAWQRNHRVSMRNDLEKLDNSEGRLGLRGILQRYGLDDSPLSVRETWQHMTVDSLAAEIRTRDEPFAGTNHSVYLQVAPGRKWLLNEKVSSGDVSDDFRPGTTTYYTLDPAEGDLNGRLHLGEVQELSLILKLAVSFPEGAWKPDRLRLEVNGREVFRQEISDELQVSITHRKDRWTATYPG